MNSMFPLPSREIVLRPHQEQSEERLREGIRNGSRRQILVAPTGYGKTEVAAHIIKQAQAKGKRAWFIVDRKALIDQTSDRFASYGIDHGIIQANHWLTDYSKPVQIASVQTLARRKIDWLPVLIVLDEAHCIYDAALKLVERASKAKVIGLTATPFTAGMADHWDGVVNGATTNFLIQKEWLVPLRIKVCVAPDMTGAKKRFDGEWDLDDAGSRGITIVGDVVQTWIEQTRKHFGGPVKTFVFSPSVDHGAELCRQFSDAGFNFQQISYRDRDDEERRAKFAEMRKPDSAIDGLVSCGVLTKGVDIPDIKCGISCRPYRKSFSAHIQEMGRVMRTAPLKKYGLWLDHSGNSLAFADDTAWLFEYGVESLSDAQKRDSEVREPKEKTRKERFCAECGTMMEPRESACPSCGWERPSRSEIQIVQGELIDLELDVKSQFKPRAGLRSPCFNDPRAMYNAALVYTTIKATTKEKARFWARGIWKGIYERWPPDSFDLMQPDPSKVVARQMDLIQREIRLFRKSARREAA
ncbi:MAG TPA: DEAD/DEAH box helicase family protein [Nitrospira sp.]|nr:DEAD/DEAH box helicase family protein [Nitrospira sp.]